MLPSATVGSSIINLANTILGAGMLAMPSAIAAVGLVFGSFLIAFSAACSAFGLYLLSRCAARTHGRDASFFRVAHQTYPQAATAIDMAIAVKCFGVGVSYLIIIGDLMPEVVSALGAQTGSLLTDRRVWISVMMLVAAPLSFLRRLDSLRYTSVAALGAVVYLLVLVVGFYLGSSDTDHLPDIPARPSPGDLPWIKLDTGLFTHLPIFVFAFTCHQNIFTVYNELADNSQRYVSQVIKYSIGAGLLIYQCIGLAGYLSFGEMVLPNIILMYPSSPVVTAGRAALVILQLFSFPLQCHPCRASLDRILPQHLFSGTADDEHAAIRPALLPQHDITSTVDAHTAGDSELDSDSEEEGEGGNEVKLVGHNPGPIPGRASDIRFVLLTSAILLASYILAMSVTKLDLVLALVGATGSTTISFILPGIFYWRMTERHTNGQRRRWLTSLTRAAAITLAGYGVCVLFVCVSFTLAGALNESARPHSVHP